MNRRGFIAGLMSSAAAPLVPALPVAKATAYGEITLATVQHAVVLLARNQSDDMLDALRYGMSVYRTRPDGAVTRIAPRDFFIEPA